MKKQILNRISQFLSAILVYKDNLYLKELKENKRILVGPYTYGDHLLKIHFFRGNDTKIIIGRYCSFASGINIITGGNHPSDWISTFPFSEKICDPPSYINGMPSSRGDIIIKNDVWVATNATILSGVTIGNGAIVCAGAVVTKDVPDYSVVGGIPASIIKYRFTENQIEQLLNIKWWDWEVEKVKENIHLLSSPNIDVFLKQHTYKNQE